MPRRITIFLSAPPGDGLRVAREHFHEYIKPVLVAGALDWEVIEGRREGEVRAGLAEKIRKLRKRNGEKSLRASSDASQEEDELLEQARQKSGIGEWDGVHGDLILGRHTWKEYVRGLHEGWLGPLEAPARSESPVDLTTNPPSDQPQSPQEPHLSSEPVLASTPSPTLSDPSFPSSQNPTPEPPEPSSISKPPPPSKPPSPPALISPASYPASSLSPSTPSLFQPSLPLPLPHLLGFINTPTRLYRFLTQRTLADTTGAAVAALVLASHSRPFTISVTNPPVNQDPDFPLTAEPSPSSTSSSAPRALAWEQEHVLAEEETEWHKSVWKDDIVDSDGTRAEPRERVWRDAMVVDDRIGALMRLFELEPGEAERAISEQEQERRAGWRGGEEEEEGWWKACKRVLGMEKEKGMKGWEMGFVGGEDE